MFDVILKATNCSFQRGMIFSLSIYTQQKKLRKFCLRGYDKKSNTFKDS